MSIRHLAASAAALLTVVAIPGTIHADATASAEAAPGDPGRAIYGDKVIDMSQSWEGAGACIVLDDESRCYDTVEELEAAHPQHTSAAADAEAGSASLMSCTPEVRLYTNTGYGGTVAILTTKGVILNLGSYGIDNATSSYWVIGGCSAGFYADINLGGSYYPGNTSAGAYASSMASGWDNRISSVYINA